MVVENAFGQLKGCWRCLLKWLDLNLKNAPAIIASCVVLHNLCEKFDDNFRDDWASENTTQNQTPSIGNTAASTH